MPRVLVDVGYDSGEVRSALHEEYTRFQAYVVQLGGNVLLAVVLIGRANKLPIIWLQRHFQRKSNYFD